MTSEVTHQSFRVTWDGPDDQPEKYRVEYRTLSGAPQQVFAKNTKKLALQVIVVQYVSVNAALMLLGNNFYFQPPVCVGFLLFGCLITLQLDTRKQKQSETNMQKFVLLQLPGFAWTVNIVDVFIDGEVDL